MVNGLSKVSNFEKSYSPITSDIDSLSICSAPRLTPMETWREVWAYGDAFQTGVDLWRTRADSISILFKWKKSRTRIYIPPNLT